MNGWPHALSDRRRTDGRLTMIWAIASILAAVAGPTACYTTGPYWTSATTEVEWEPEVYVPSGELHRARLDPAGGDHDIVTERVPLCRQARFGVEHLVEEGSTLQHTWPAWLLGAGMAVGGSVGVMASLDGPIDEVPIIVGSLITAIGAIVLGHTTLSPERHRSVRQRTPGDRVGEWSAEGGAVAPCPSGESERIASPVRVQVRVPSVNSAFHYDVSTADAGTRRFPSAVLENLAAFCGQLTIQASVRPEGEAPGGACNEDHPDHPCLRLELEQSKARTVTGDRLVPLGWFRDELVSGIATRCMEQRRTAVLQLLDAL